MFLGYSLVKNNKLHLLLKQTDKKIETFKNLKETVIPSKG